MSKLNLGKVALTPKGEWNASTTYERLDVVSYEGSSYTVLKECRGIFPVEGEFYSLLAMKGDKGDPNTLAVSSEDTLALGGIQAQSILKGISVEWFVSTTGNDTTGDGSQDKPWRTIQKAINNIRKYHYRVSIRVSAGSYNESIDLSNKNAFVDIVGPEVGIASCRSILINNITSVVTLNNMSVISTSDTPTYGIYVVNTANVYLSNVIIQGYNNLTIGIYARTSLVYVNALVVSKCDKAVSAMYGATVFIASRQINGNDVVWNENNIGLDAYNSIIVSPGGYNDNMASTLFSKRYGGLIFIDGQEIGDIIENPPLADGWEYTAHNPDEKSYLYKTNGIVVGNLNIKSTKEHSQWDSILMIPYAWRPVCRSTFWIGDTGIYFFKSGVVNCSISQKVNDVINVSFTYKIID